MNRRSFLSFVAAAPVGVSAAAAQALTASPAVAAVDVQRGAFEYIRYGDRAIARAVGITPAQFTASLAALIEDAERRLSEGSQIRDRRAFGGPA